MLRRWCRWGRKPTQKVKDCLDGTDAVERNTGIDGTVSKSRHAAHQQERSDRHREEQAPWQPSTHDSTSLRHERSCALWAKVHERRLPDDDAGVQFVALRQGPHRGWTGVGHDFKALKTSLPSPRCVSCKQISFSN